MAVPRAKKAKKRIYTEKDLVKRVEYANYLNLSIMVRYFYTEKGYRQKRLEDMIEGYLSLLDEVADKRATVFDEMDDCNKLTGFDIKELVDKVIKNHEEKRLDIERRRTEEK